MSKVGLIVEGGGLRGLFATGVLDVFMDNGVEIVVIISDWQMPGMKGDEFLIEAHKICPKVEKIMLSGQADALAIQRVKDEANLREFISKPWDAQHLIQVIKDALKLKESTNSTPSIKCL
mgnify:CR=1 FL=1